MTSGSTGAASRVFAMRGAFASGSPVVSISLPETEAGAGPWELFVHVDGGGEGRPVLSGFASIVAPEGLDGDLEVSTLRAIPLPGHARPLLVEEATSRLGLGGSVWDGALVLIEYLLGQAGLFRGRRCLDLGCGTGLLGLSSAALGARSVLADRPPIVTLARANIDRNCGTVGDRAAALPHLWGTDVAVLSPPFDVVLLSDLTYDVAAAPSLCRTLDAVCSPATLVLLSHRRRSAAGDEAVFAMLDARFSRRAVAAAPTGEVGRFCTDVVLYELRSRPGREGVGHDPSCRPGRG